MVVKAIQTVAKAQNGLGAFILQCKRLDFHYCDWAGSSKGMNSFIRHHLPLFAKEFPQVEITVSPRPNKHPVVRAHYVNGRSKAICVKNLEKLQIRQKVDLLKNDDGKKLIRSKKVVDSTNESVRGIFSNIHANKISIGLDGLPMKKR